MASGKLTFDKSGVGSGRYTDLHHTIDISFEPAVENVAAVIGKDAPSHNVYIASRGGHLSLGGAAWAKRIATGPSAGQVFFSIQIDDPSFGATLNLSAFPEMDANKKPIEGAFEIVWRRPRQAAA